MSLRNPINIRLSDEQLIRYENESAKLGIPLATYLRKQLEANENLLEEISALRREVSRAVAFIEESGSGEIAAVLEILLLLRQMALPQKVQFAQAELKRLGFTIWSSEGGE
jgi:hypothetical protein